MTETQQDPEQTSHDAGLPTPPNVHTNAVSGIDQTPLDGSPAQASSEPLTVDHPTSGDPDATREEVTDVADPEPDAEPDAGPDAGDQGSDEPEPGQEGADGES